MSERSELPKEVYERFVGLVNEGNYDGEGWWGRAIDSMRVVLIKGLISGDIEVEVFVEVVGSRSEELLNTYKSDMEGSDNGKVSDWEEFELILSKVSEVVDVNK